MAHAWRRQRIAAWEVLLDFDHSTIAAYSYLSTGPAATQTGCIRIHKRRLRRELNLRGTQVDAVIADLAGEGLLVAVERCNVLTLYLSGFLVDCPPMNQNSRRGYIKEILAYGDNDATRAALADLALSGATDLQVIEHTGGSLSTLAHRSLNVVAEKRQDKTRREEKDSMVADAPQTPAAPKKDWREQPWAPMVEAYKRRLPKRPQPRDATLNGALGKSLAKRWKEHPDAQWWDRLFELASKDDWYSGRGSWSGVSLLWISKPSALDKATTRFHAQLATPQPGSPPPQRAKKHAWTCSLEEWLEQELPPDADDWQRQQKTDEWTNMNGGEV